MSCSNVVSFPQFVTAERGNRITVQSFASMFMNGVDHLPVKNFVAVATHIFFILLLRQNINLVVLFHCDCFSISLLQHFFWFECRTHRDE